MRLKNIKIKGFRGFNKEESIPLDSDIILIYGLNGSGKSSLTEAIEWLFFGEISRQRLSRCKSEYQYEEYLKNLYYQDKTNPYVEIKGELDSKSLILRKEITPTGDKNFIDGKEVPDFKSLKLNLENYFRPMLAQTEIKALVDSEQKDRWEQLSCILGQDDLTTLRENLITLRNNKKSEIYDENERKWKSIIDEILNSPDLIIFETPVRTLNISLILSTINQILKSKLNNLEDSLEEIKSREKGLLNNELGSRLINLSYLDSSDITIKFSSIKNNFKDLEELAIVSTKEGHDHVYLDFLKSGIQYLKFPECPFCLEKVIKDKRVKDIRETLQKGETAQKAKQNFTELKQSTDKEINIVIENLMHYFPLQSELKKVALKLNDINEIDFASSTQQIDKEITDFTSKIRTELNLIKNQYYFYLENKYFHQLGDSKKPPTGIDEIIQKIIGSQRVIVTKWEETKLKIIEKLHCTDCLDQKELNKLLLLEKIITFFTRSTQFIKTQKLITIIDSIQLKLEDYEKKEVTRLLQVHASEIKNYYQKLNQGDSIQFSGIEVKGGSRRQAKLKAEAFGKDVNPVTIFSEAHTNSLALSIYFPQRVDRNFTWNVMILDDPVQSMDENHSHALIDILFDASKNKQIIVLTHSKSFFKRLCARFQPLKPKVYSFFNSDDLGPKIILDEGETLSYLKIIDENCKKGDPKSLETASQHLRKAIESVCIEILINKGISFSRAQKAQKDGLDNLFIEVEKKGMIPIDIAKLKSLLDTSHSNSHAWSIVDTTPGGINSGRKYIQEVYDSYLK